MLTDLLRRLSSRPEKDTLLPAEDQRVAVAALLVIAAHADHDYADIERVHIERALAQRYGLDAAAAAALRAEGEAAEQASVDLYRFTSLVKTGVPLEERAAVIEAMWRVILSDAAREKHEEALMRRVTDLLGLDPREGVVARQRAQASL
jgi:uncharacterized tellurite resistance protein B-like protein